MEEWSESDLFPRDEKMDPITGESRLRKVIQKITLMDINFFRYAKKHVLLNLTLSESYTFRENEIPGGE